MANSTEPNIAKIYHQGYSLRERVTINTTINEFTDFTEIIHYKEPFEVMYGKSGYDLIDTQTGEVVHNRKRKFYKDEDGAVVPRSPKTTYGELAVSMKRSDTRAKDKFYSYGLCNHWKYFATFTVATAKFDCSDESTKYYWKLFRQRFQYQFPDAKLLNVPEEHKKGNLHFHTLIGDCDLTHLLTPAINPHTNKPIIDKGNQVYNLELWDKGFSTVKIIPEGSEHQIKVVQYLIKYLTKKNGRVRYNEKKYYRTNNLAEKTKKLSFREHKAIKKSFHPADLIYEKEDDARYIYRIKKNRTLTEDKDGQVKFNLSGGENGNYRTN